MSAQIQDALLKTNQTYRNYDNPHDFNMTDFLENEVDIFYFRIVDQVNNLGRQNTKSIYLSPDGDVTIRRGQQHFVYPEEHQQESSFLPPF